MKSKNSYITGLKGISCILVMIGHFLGLYKYAEHFFPNSSLLDAILNSRVSFVLNANYWLYLFLYLSGYLVAKSQVKTIKDIVLKSVKRFFRFAFPILFSYFVIYLIYILIGFHNANTVNLFQCDWFQNYYVEQYNIKQVLLSPIDVLFLCRCSLNGVYWVLRDMFISSIIIYILKYCYCTFSEKNERLCFLFLITIVLAFLLVSSVIFACLLGMFISICEDVEEILSKSYFIIGITLISMFQYILFHQYIFNIFFIFLIVLSPKIACINDILSSKLFSYLGEISWGIYSFHWPLICSLGALLIIKLQPQLGLLYSYVITCVIISFITVIISGVFKLTFERLASYLVVAIDKFLKRIVLHSSTINE